MKIAFYIGDHAKDTVLVQAGWWLTRLAQKGPYSHITHCEAIHEEYKDGSVLIAGASARDAGVRSKVVKLNTEKWIVVDIPQWDVQLSIDLLARTRGHSYDWVGAIATALPGKARDNSWFCNEWVSEPYLLSSSNFGPHQLAAICLSIGTHAQ
jgi:hypothetical protein